MPFWCWFNDFWCCCHIFPFQYFFLKLSFNFHAKLSLYICFSNIGPNLKFYFCLHVWTLNHLMWCKKLHLHRCLQMILIVISCFSHLIGFYNSYEQSKGCFFSLWIEQGVVIICTLWKYAPFTLWKIVFIETIWARN